METMVLQRDWFVVMPTQSSLGKQGFNLPKSFADVYMPQKNNNNKKIFLVLLKSRKFCHQPTELISIVA